MELSGGLNEDVGLLVGVGPDEPLPVRPASDAVSDGVAVGLEVSVGEPDGPGEEESVGVGLVDVVGVADGEDVVGVTDGDDVPVSVGVGVADGLALAVGLGLLDGEADGQGAEVLE